MNQTKGGSFFLVAASRFIPLELVGVGFIRCSGFQGEPLDPIPSLLPRYDYKYSFNQALSISMGSGIWDDRKMETYNMVDAIYRSTVQVYPLAWTAILINLDNLGIWNLRSQDAEKWNQGKSYI